jgi:serine/threonine protein kinase
VSGGELKIDDYELVNCIATGNYSQIWEVIDGATSEHLAMKLLLPVAMAESSQLQILKHEAKVAQSLEHPNLIQFHKLVAGKGSAYILMEYFRGASLKTQIHSDPAELQKRFRKLFESICLVLAYMHDRGWVHRDIKPDNILMNKGSELRLIDFSLSSKHATGLSKLFAGKKSKTIQGTRTYIAPETLKKEAAVPQTDTYSLGITFYEILTGLPPFTGMSPNALLRKHLSTTPPPPSEMNPNVTPEMDRIILKMLAKKPANRHASMNELLSEFRAIKPFHDEEGIGGQVEEDDEESLANMGRIDSRTDAKRTEDYLNDPSSVPPPTPAQPKQPTPVPQQPAMPQQPAYGQPMQPQPGYAYPPGTMYPQQPGMPQPGMIQPAMPQMPGQVPMSGYPAGMPMQPQMPMMPGQVPMQPQQMQPQMPMQPQQPMPPGYPVGAPQQYPPQEQGGMPQQAPPQPVTQQPAAPAPSSAPVPSPLEPTDDGTEDIPFMDELPDII